MNILLLASHAVAEFDDIRMFHDLGYGIFAPGGYENPATSGEGIRPALPDVPYHSYLVAACNRVRAERGEPGPAIDWAKAALPDEVIDWADVIIAHHFVDRWIGAQWPRIRHKRVIWRTCGQSNPGLESYMGQFVREGLQVVRYSPAEERYFTRVGSFAGQDALIRFGKYPDDYGPWEGWFAGVINITQHMAQRGDACGYRFWSDATRGLARLRGDDGPPPPYAVPLGPGSETIGGRGALAHDEMLAWLRRARVYLYTGTRPASYTLGLLEAALSGIPVVSIGPGAWGNDWDAADLFEGHLWSADGGYHTETPEGARKCIRAYLDDPELARGAGERVRERVVREFGIDTVGPQWVEFLR